MSLRKAATRGVKWTGAASFAATALQLVRLVVLARLLSPEDFGLMAMITVLMGFAGTFADTGFSNAIIFRQETTREQISSLYWTTWVTGLIIFVALIAVTPLAVLFYHEPRIYSLLPWAAVSFLIAPVGQQFKVLLQRDLQFREIAAIDVSGAAFGVVASIILALEGYGIYALVFGQLLGSVADSLLCALIGWRRWAPKFHFNFADLKAFASFGAFQMGERFTNIFSANIDYLLVGRILGPVALGSYTIAYQLIVAPVSRINPILTRVAFPIFAKRQNDTSALRLGYLEISKFLALVTCPILVGIAATAPILVPALLGSRWNDAVLLVEILAPVGLYKTLANPMGSVLLAKGRADIGFWLNICIAIEYLIGFSISVGFGLSAVAMAGLIMGIMNFLLCQMITNHILSLTWKSYLGSIALPVMSSLFMGAVVRLALRFVEKSLGNNLLSAGVLVLTGAIVYLLCILLFDQHYIRRLIGLLKFGH